MVSEKRTYDWRGMTEDFEGMYCSPKLQWWCSHAYVETPQGQQWSVYLWPIVDSIDETWLASLPGFEMVDPARFQIRAEGGNARADLEVVRQPHRLMLRTFLGDPFEESDAIGMYGAGRTIGTVEVPGRTYEVDGPSFGSALFFGSDGVF